MSGIDIFTLFVMLVIAATIVYVFIFLGMWPGKVARQRNHPQADAINIGSWIGLIAGGVLWPLVLIWAYTQPLIQRGPGSEHETGADLETRLQQLGKRLAALETQQSD